MGQQALFSELEPQGDLFGKQAGYKRVVNPDKVRPRIHNFIAELQTSETMPWSPAILRLRKEIVPRMIGYLPEEERPALKAQFDAEISRLAVE